MDDIEDYDESLIDEELNLPGDLVNLNLQAKKELLLYKRSHNELDWEQEVLRRIDTMGKRKDLEQLRLLASEFKGGTSAPPSTIAAKKPRQPTVVKKRTRLAESESESDDATDPKRRKPTSTRASAPRLAAKPARDDDDDESDDDLFNSDEEEEANTLAVSPAKQPQTRSKLSKVAKSRSRLEEYEEDDESDGGDYMDTDDEATSRRRPGRGRGVPVQERGQVRGRGSDEEREYEEEADTSEPAELVDYQRLQVRRMFIEKWLLEPYFEKVVTGQFCRIYVGQNPSNDTPIYRMCEITGIVPNKRGLYKLTDSGMQTDRAMQVTIGRSTIVKKFDLVSNSRITEHELARYLEDVRVSDEASGKETKVLTKNAAQRRRNRAASALHNYQYSKDDLKALIQQRSGFSSLYTTEFTTARANLREKIVKLQENPVEGSDAQILKMQKELDDMEEKYEAHKARLKVEAGKQKKLNQRNRDANIQNDISASEKRREKAANADSTSAGDSAMDPFRRRETLPQIIWNTSGSFRKEGTAPSEKEREAAAAKARREEAKKAVVNSAQGNAVTLDLCADTNVDTVVARVRDRLGAGIIMPLLQALEASTAGTVAEETRRRYLEAACQHLPPAGSSERESVRTGMSLQSLLAKAE